MSCMPLLRCLGILLFTSICTTSLFAQQKTITGKITDEQNGQPLSGVTISIKSITISTVSGNDGVFTIAVPL